MILVLKKTNLNVQMDNKSNVINSLELYIKLYALLYIIVLIVEYNLYIITFI